VEDFTTEYTEDTEERGGTARTMELNDVTGQVVDAAMKVHTALGPGLLEHVYAICLRQELEERGLSVQSEVAIPVVYNHTKIENAFRIDLLVEDQVIVGLKAVEKVLAVHKAQLLTYLKLSNRKIGLLLNFNVPHMKDGITRMAN